MRKIIYSMPDQIFDAITLIPDTSLKKRRFNKVLICGMGGSGISGEILKAIYPALQIISNKDYSIPEYIDRYTLSILVSYSGNTEETLNNYRILSKRKTGIAVISSNGKLLKKKSELKIKIPGGLPPRGAIGYLFTPLPFILYKFHLINTEPEQKLISLARFLNKRRNVIEKKAKILSKKLLNRLPIIYSNSQTFFPVARRWQCQLNENSKVLAHINIIPEMNHNEIVGLGKPEALNSKISLIFINDPKAHPRNRARVKILKETIKNKFSNIIDIEPEGKNSLHRLFWTIMLGDFISYYVAIKTNVDPMPVKRIDYLKKRLSRIQ
ncbi:MAG: bifunctional phosphoglucose/phosphomannose isomerase [Candidatus Stahlbacteria bacterium]|nr:MAG: bifunctional phosphoglucose/phosphomannose isomerase [Candidatus Stahlbacteria bacterium]